LRGSLGSPAQRAGRPDDVAETTYIPPVRDDHDEYDNYDYPDDDYHDEPDDEPRSSRPPAASGGRRAYTVFRSIGELCLTAGMVVLLFVVYEVYVTNIFSAQKQSTATQQLNQQWNSAGTARSTHFNVADGQGVAKMFIPALGVDYQFTVIEGTTQADLAIGPGHYTGTALPGQPGNFAVAGHRVGEGDPFNDIDLVQPCDAIVVETQSDWYVYRMLPLKNQRDDWNPASNPLCNGPNGDAKVKPLGGAYGQTDGQEIVLPTEGDVIAPVPHCASTKLSSAQVDPSNNNSDVVPTAGCPASDISAGQEASLMTMTTCNPKFSDVQRLIVHSVLVKDWQKDPAHPNYTPPELKETS
ncbi:MAG TPA: class E sortase, partial [Pseudonocardiaceae bacterium]|nr:class E sortase [Pseudonocardiaceae bacterium]